MALKPKVYVRIGGGAITGDRYHAIYTVEIETPPGKMIVTRRVDSEDLLDDVRVVRADRLRDVAQSIANGLDGHSNYARHEDAWFLSVVGVSE